MRFTTFLASGLALTLVACGGSDAPAPKPTPKVEAPTVTKAPTPAPAATPGEPSAEFASLPEPYASADYARGKRTYKNCSSCHLTAEGAGDLVGPNLYGLFGRKAGEGDYAYSKALKEADFEWTPEKLDEWLASPRSFLPGNRMSFAGVRKPEDRVAVIAFLMSETGYEAE